MDDERLHFEQGVCLVGGGHVCPEVLAKALKFAPVLVAADGGADSAIAAGHIPDLVIGDLDSIDADTLARFQAHEVICVDDQDTTDFEKCLERICAPYVISVGFTGGRLDHTLAVLSVLARRVGPPALLLDCSDVTFPAGRGLSLSIPAGTRFSLFPLADVTGCSRGLRWPIDGIDFSPTGRIGTSNEATGPVTLEFDAQGMLVVLPASELEAVMKVLFG